MRITQSILTSMLLLGSCNAASAQQLIDGASVDAIVQVARAFGSATVESQSNGAPKIAGRMDGIGYTIFFVNCTSPRQCSDLNFYAGFLEAKLTPDQLNSWNATKRFGRAYADPDGDAVVEMDVNLEGGVSRNNITSVFGIWRLMLDQFTSYIGFT